MHKQTLCCSDLLSLLPPPIRLPRTCESNAHDTVHHLLSIISKLKSIKIVLIAELILCIYPGWRYIIYINAYISTLVATLGSTMAVWRHASASLSPRDGGFVVFIMWVAAFLLHPPVLKLIYTCEICSTPAEPLFGVKICTPRGATRLRLQRPAPSPMVILATVHVVDSECTSSGARGSRNVWPEVSELG